MIPTNTPHVLPPRSLLSLSLLGLLAAAAAPLQAQVVPGAGQSIRDIERRPLVLPPRQQLELNLPDEGPAPVAAGDATRIAVRAFRFAGNSRIDEATLAASLADLAGRELSLAELQDGVRRITRLYHERGYPLARAWLPRQEIADGVVRIEVLEGRLGQVRVQDHANLQPAALAPLRRLQPGDVVAAAPLEHALLLLRDLAGVRTSATLQPGAAVGTTDLVVDTSWDRWFHGSIEADNYGNYYTGEYRLGTALEVGNLFGLGDRLDLRLLGTDEGQLYGRLGWQGQTGRWGTQVGAAWSQMDYALGKEFDVLDASGFARVASAWVTQPLLRTRALSLSASLQFDDRQLEDLIGLVDSRNPKHARVWRATLSGNGNDAWLGGGLSAFSLVASQGRLRLQDADFRDADSVTARTQGSFGKLEASLLRLQRLPGAFSLYAQADAQWADGNLESSEKMVLGGAYGVRAYPQGEAAGDEGWLARLELRYAIAPAWQLATFLEQGEVRINRDPWDESRNHRRLAGAGVGANWSSGPWHAQAGAAWRLDGEPATAGPDRSPRFLVQAGCSF